jgi:hypothetical protein
MAEDDTPEGGQLPPRDEQLALLLAGGNTAAEAGKQVHLSVRTIRRRLGDEAFRRRVNDLRAEMTAEALGVLSAAQGDAARKLATLARGSAREDIALAAAKAVLDMAGKLREQADLARRVAEMEALLAGEANP